MSKPKWRVKMGGEEVKIDTLPIGELASFLQIVEAGIEGILEAEPGSHKPGTRVSLVEISPGSVSLGLLPEEEAIPAVRAFSEATLSRDFSALPKKTKDAGGKLYQFQKRHQASITLDPVPEYGIEGGTVQADLEPAPTPATVHLTGTTILYGNVISVGGKTPKVHLEIEDSKRQVTFGVSIEMAKELAHFLFVEVGVEAEVTWDTTSWEMTGKEILRVLHYRPTSALEAIAELKKVAGKGFDGVDASEFVRKLRDE